MKKLAIVLFLFGVAGSALYLRQEWRSAGEPVEGGTLEIPHGLGTREIVGLLQEKKVVRNGVVTLAYILYSGNRNKLQAGEYAFDRPMTIPEVIGRLASGSVVLHKFTIPEGLTVEAIAAKWQDEGFGPAGDFSKTAAEATDLVRRFDDKAV